MSNYSLTLGGAIGIQPLNLTGGLDVGLDDIHIKELPLIKLDVTSNNKVDLGLDNIRIKELPKIELELSIKPTRVEVPTHYQMCFSVLGLEMFKLALCGETMLITQPYVPHETEKCA
jgi:hypothetical protein